MRTWRRIVAMALSVLAVLALDVASTQNADGASAENSACRSDQAGQQVCSREIPGAWGFPDFAQGWMTGAGVVAGRGDSQLVYAAKLTCGTARTNNATGQAIRSRELSTLEIRWGKGTWFRLDSVTSAACSDNPAIVTKGRAATFDTHTGAGTGRLNGVSGATVEWTITDAGEPRRNDTARFVIKDRSGRVVLSASGKSSQIFNQARN